MTCLFEWKFLPFNNPWKVKFCQETLLSIEEKLVDSWAGGKKGKELKLGESRAPQHQNPSGSPASFPSPTVTLPPSPTANAACQLHHRCARIAVLWLANDTAEQPNSCWDPDHHVPTTIKKNTRVRPKHPNPAALRGALNVSQWDDREILKRPYWQIVIYRTVNLRPTSHETHVGIQHATKWLL